VRGTALHARRHAERHPRAVQQHQGPERRDCQVHRRARRDEEADRGAQGERCGARQAAAGAESPDHQRHPRGGRRAPHRSRLGQGPGVQGALVVPREGGMRLRHRARGQADAQRDAERGPGERLRPERWADCARGRQAHQGRRWRTAPFRLGRRKRQRWHLGRRRQDGGDDHQGIMCEQHPRRWAVVILRLPTAFSYPVEVSHPLIPNRCHIATATTLLG